MEEFKKRVDKNKPIYADIKKQINSIDEKSGKKEFSRTRTTLANINGDLFDAVPSNMSENNSIDEYKKKQTKNLIITIAVSLAILVFIIIMAVIISNGK